jgi:RNA-splicing ligase RtcB
MSGDRMASGARTRAVGDRAPRTPAVAVAEPPAPPSSCAHKVRILTAGDRPDPALVARLDTIAELPFVEHVLALPDLHQKERMEVPSSLAITTRGTIVPEFTSVAVNDGMGVVRTDLDVSDLTPERIERFFARINAHSAAHFLDSNRYSLSARDLRAAALEGGRAVLARYGLPHSALRRMERDAHVPVPHGAEAWSAAVPGWLRASPLGRCEMGLNFGGNHFLEVQFADAVIDSWSAARWGIERKRVVIMYHLGPGPFSGTLLHHYTRREKLRGPRRPLFFLSKLLLHRRHASAGTWRLHFRRNGWTAYAADSEEGLRIRQALAMATNFGFAYRLATVAAIRDALHDAISPAVGAELLCDTSHNGVFEEPWGTGSAWVARHNACRVTRGGPAIVAGAADVPSYLARAAVVGPHELHSHDHGAGHLIEVARRAGELARDGGLTTRVHMSRGRQGRMRSAKRLPVLTSEPVDRLMTCFALNEVMQPVVRLRPAGTLKN